MHDQILTVLNPKTLTVAANVLIVDDYNSQDTSPMDIIFCSPQNLKGRIREYVRLDNSNDNQNDSGLNETNRMLLDEILKLFPDLGEILMLDNIVLNRKKE